VLFFKHYNAHSAKYLQSIKERFIANCINLIPNKIETRLKQYTKEELEPLIKNDYVLEEIR
jgi:chromosome segregation ATPase